jgi:hypothetical protein
MRDHRTVIDRSLIPHSSAGVFDANAHGAISSATKDQANQKIVHQQLQELANSIPRSRRIHRRDVTVSSSSFLETPIAIGRPKHPPEREKAARQQGGLFFRENSSNGGKAIRTFWLHTKFGQNRCQGQNFEIATCSKQAT